MVILVRTTGLSVFVPGLPHALCKMELKSGGGRVTTGGQKRPASGLLKKHAVILVRSAGLSGFVPRLPQAFCKRELKCAVKGVP